MFVARIVFRVGGGDRDRVASCAYDLVVAWYKNGQVVHNGWPIAALEDRVEAVVRVPEATSLDERNHNVYAKEALANLLPVVPEVELLGPEPESLAACACSASSALVLFTHYVSVDPPVRCLDCFGAVPLYRLPHVHDHEHLELLHWAADYRACDTLQMHCTTGERFGERQLSDHDSSLSRNGRALAAKLEARSGTPVFYYLHKMRSRGRVAELARLCPSCNGPWRLQHPVHAFHFRCESCRLMSSLATDSS